MKDCSVTDGPAIGQADPRPTPSRERHGSGSASGPVPLNRLRAFGKTPGGWRGVLSSRNRLWLVPMLAPFVFYGCMLLALVARFGNNGLGRFGVIVAGDWFYVIPGTGKLLAVPLMVQSSIHPVLAAASTVFMDTVVAFAVAFNFNQVQRLPLIDRIVGRLMKQSDELLNRRPLLRKFSFVGLVCFVTIPVEGAGGVGGTVLGMMMGLGPGRAWSAVLLGSSLRSLSLAYSANAARELLARYHYIGYLALVLCAGVIGFSLYRGRRKALAARGVRAGSETDASSDP